MNKYYYYDTQSKTIESAKNEAYLLSALGFYHFATAIDKYTQLHKGIVMLKNYEVHSTALFYEMSDAENWVNTQAYYFLNGLEPEDLLLVALSLEEAKEKFAKLGLEVRG